MKHENPSFANGMFKFNCPHCKGEIEINAEVLSQVNTEYAGKYPCPLDGCAKEIEFPTTAEAEALQATASALAAPPMGGAAPAPAPPPQGNPAATPTAAPTGRAAAPPSQPTVTPPEIVPGFHGSKMASLEREAVSVHRLCVKTILHGDCVKDKKDTFDETVSKFLSDLEEGNLIGVHPVQYTADEKKGTDFGVLVVYRTTPEEE
ncbi:MAG TPA: hypothetical protein EYQ62_01710 [Verrucomicrobiales bacterium]|nr:hypothetical protein [Verrucomicrobiales bacterium]